MEVFNSHLLGTECRLRLDGSVGGGLGLHRRNWPARRRNGATAQAREKFLETRIGAQRIAAGRDRQVDLLARQSEARLNGAERFGALLAQMIEFDLVDEELQVPAV